MNISDLLLDTNSIASEESFADFFNNEAIDGVEVQPADSNITNAAIKEDTTKAFNPSNRSIVKEFFEGETSANVESLIETSTEDFTQVIFGSYTSAIVLGRGRSATINLGESNRKVSRKHAVISWEEAMGMFNIRITGANGLFIDNSIYKANCSVKLAHGSIIDIAGIKYRFQVPHLDYLPSPPFESPAHIYESEKKQCLLAKDDLKISSRKNKNRDSDIIHKIADGLPNLVTQYGSTEQKTLHNISPSSSICNSMSKSNGNLMDESSDSEFLSHTVKSGKKRKQSNASGRRDVKTNGRRRNDRTCLQKQSDSVHKGLVDNIVSAIVFSGKHMLSASEIYKTILADHPRFPEKFKEFNELSVVRCLHQNSFFGHVIRKGKDAGGKPLADLWYYTINNDPDASRKETYKTLVKGTRACTLRDKQYYFKPPPKVPSIKYSTQLPSGGKKRSKKSKGLKSNVSST